MNKKASEAVNKLNKHLQKKGDTEGLMILNELLAALAEGDTDVLRKRA